MPELDEIVSAVSSAKKYRFVCPDTIRRIARHELAHHGKTKKAIKATKRRLHQVYGAFEQDFDYDIAYRQLQIAYERGTIDDVKATCRSILGAHSSTHERLPILDRFYATLFEITDRPASLLDLGCGLNPLTLPWMDLPAGVRYVAFDIDANRVDFLNRYLALTGLQSQVHCQDVLVRPPDEAADVAFLLKMSPSLERQEEGSTLHLIEQLKTPSVVVSFAVKSLGGREKGMVEHYQQQFLELIQGQRWQVEMLVFETELVFVIKREM